MQIQAPSGGVTPLPNKDNVNIINQLQIHVSVASAALSDATHLLDDFQAQRPSGKRSVWPESAEGWEAHF